MRLKLRRSKPLDKEKYKKRWQDLQKLCAVRKTWPQALYEADQLLDDALKNRHYKGNTTGARLVSAQHELTSNDAVWFSHKYCSRVSEIDVRKLKKKEVAVALAGFRQALRDLGALEP